MSAATELLARSLRLMCAGAGSRGSLRPTLFGGYLRLSLPEGNGQSQDQQDQPARPAWDVYEALQLARLGRRTLPQHGICRSGCGSHTGGEGVISSMAARAMQRAMNAISKRSLIAPFAMIFIDLSFRSLRADDNSTSAPVLARGDVTDFFFVPSNPHSPAPMAGLFFGA